MWETNYTHTHTLTHTHTHTQNVWNAINIYLNRKVHVLLENVTTCTPCLVEKDKAQPKDLNILDVLWPFNWNVYDKDIQPANNITVNKYISGGIVA